MIDYFDASAVAAILLSETAGGKVSAIIKGSEADIVVSQFGIAETSSAFTRLYRMKERSQRQAEDLLADIDRWVETTADLTEVVSDDFIRATDLVRELELKLRAPDALHLAIAERLEARLITLDANLYAAALAVGLQSHNPAEAEAPGEPKD